MQEFLSQVADILDEPSVTPETRFRELEDWSSLKAFGLLVLLDSTYHHPVSIKDFMALDTVGSLARAAGL